MTAKTYQLLEDVKHKLYTTIDHIKAISTMEGDKQILFLWKKLLGDYYRNLAVIVPEESQNARTMYKDALDVCSPCRSAHGTRSAPSSIPTTSTSASFSITPAFWPRTLTTSARLSECASSCSWSSRSRNTSPLTLLLPPIWNLFDVMWFYGGNSSKYTFSSFSVFLVLASCFMCLYLRLIHIYMNNFTHLLSVSQNFSSFIASPCLLLCIYNYFYSFVFATIVSYVLSYFFLIIV